MFCASCGNNITESEEYLLLGEDQSRAWHSRCFACSICSRECSQQFVPDVWFFDESLQPGQRGYRQFPPQDPDETFLYCPDCHNDMYVRYEAAMTRAAAQEAARQAQLLAQQQAQQQAAYQKQQMLMQQQQQQQRAEQERLRSEEQARFQQIAFQQQQQQAQQLEEQRRRQEAEAEELRRQQAEQEAEQRRAEERLRHQELQAQLHVERQRQLQERQERQEAERQRMQQQQHAPPTHQHHAGGAAQHSALDELNSMLSFESRDSMHEIRRPGGASLSASGSNPLSSSGAFGAPTANAQTPASGGGVPLGTVASRQNSAGQLSRAPPASVTEIAATNNCVQCGGPVMQDAESFEEALVIEGNLWHARCLHCAGCGSRLVAGDEMVAIDLSEGEVVRINHFHVGCVVCSLCRASIGRDDYALDERDNIICVSCHDSALDQQMAFDANPQGGLSLLVMPSAPVMPAAPAGYRESIYDTVPIKVTLDAERARFQGQGQAPAAVLPAPPGAAQNSGPNSGGRGPNYMSNSKIRQSILIRPGQAVVIGGSGSESHYASTRFSAHVVAGEMDYKREPTVQLTANQPKPTTDSSTVSIASVAAAAKDKNRDRRLTKITSSASGFFKNAFKSAKKKDKGSSKDGPSDFVWGTGSTGDLPVTPSQAATVPVAEAALVSTPADLSIVEKSSDSTLRGRVDTHQTLGADINLQHNQRHELAGLRLQLKLLATAMERQRVENEEGQLSLEHLTSLVDRLADEKVALTQHLTELEATKKAEMAERAAAYRVMATGPGNGGTIR